MSKAGQYFKVKKKKEEYYYMYMNHVDIQKYWLWKGSLL